MTALHSLPNYGPVFRETGARPVLPDISNVVIPNLSVRKVTSEKLRDKFVIKNLR